MIKIIIITNHQKYHNPPHRWSSKIITIHHIWSSQIIIKNMINTNIMIKTWCVHWWCRDRRSGRWWRQLVLGFVEFECTKMKKRSQFEVNYFISTLSMNTKALGTSLSPRWTTDNPTHGPTSLWTYPIQINKIQINEILRFLLTLLRILPISLPTLGQLWTRFKPLKERRK